MNVQTTFNSFCLCIHHAARCIAIIIALASCLSCTLPRPNRSLLLLREREREREDDDDISLSSHGETAVASVFTSPRDKGAVKKGERIAEIVSVNSWATRGKKQESFRDTQSVK